MVGLTECETVVENFFDFHFFFFLATVMVGYMYEEVEKDDVEVGRQRESARERERDDITTSFGRVEVDDLTNQREHILLSDEQSHNDGKT